MAIVVGIAIILAFTRYLDIPFFLTASRPPQIQQVAIAWIGIGVLIFLLSRAPKWILGLWLALLLGVFLVLKTFPEPDRVQMRFRKA
jgi:hypothetical protein